MAAPDDTSEIEAAISRGEVIPAGIIAVMGKTEGNGCVNDFSRGFAVQSLRLLLGRYLEPPALAKISIVMSGGTEGAMAPHWLVFEIVERESVPPGAPALAVAATATRDLMPEEIGRLGQVDAVADGVCDAMKAAAIESPSDVHFVQVKCPLLTADRVREANYRASTTATTDTLKSMGLSRGAASLGVAVALGEISRESLSDHLIGRDFEYFSSRASASAGIELMANEIIVFGMSAEWTGPLTIDHAVMADNIDIGPLRELLQRQGLAANGQLTPKEQERLVAILAKAEAASDGRLRGRRHTMLNDSDISATRHARGFVAGAVAGLVGHSEIYVSGGAEHQGPDGGGPCAMIVRSPIS